MVGCSLRSRERCIAAALVKVSPLRVSAPIEQSLLFLPRSNRVVAGQSLWWYERDKGRRVS